MTDEWDIAIGREGEFGSRIVFPRPVTRAFVEKGYNRTKLRITAEGILLVPYKSDRVAKNGRAIEPAELPDWNAA